MSPCQPSRVRLSVCATITAAFIVVGIIAGGAAANDASLGVTLRDATRSGSALLGSPTLRKYSPHFGKRYLDIVLKYVNLYSGAAQRGEPAEAFDKISKIPLPADWVDIIGMGLRRAAAVEYLADFYRTQFVIVRISLKADDASSANGRIAKALGIEAATTMIRALDALKRSGEAKRKILFHLDPRRCTPGRLDGASCFGKSDAFTPAEAFYTGSQSALDLLRAALRRLG